MKLKFQEGALSDKKQGAINIDEDQHVNKDEDGKKELKS